jgi:class III cytochrome C family protein
MYAKKNWLIGGILMLALSAVPPVCRGMNMPDSIALDSLVQLYDKVKFDHARHINLIKDCAECHHHTTGTLVENPNCIRCHKNSSETTVVACKGCHLAQPFSAETVSEKNNKLYHQDKPGLKGAYHQNCMGCHTKMGGPTGCLDCHPRNKAGDALYNSGANAPKKPQKHAARHGH